MPRAQEVVRAARGLFTQHGALNEAPDGAMLVADNCVVDREGLVTKRRGFKRYGSALQNPGSRIFQFNARLIVLDGDTLKYDSDSAGTWASYDGSFAPPDPLVAMQGQSINRAFFVTTTKGVFRNDSITDIDGFSRAGMPKGLDIEPAVTGIGGSWFTPDTRVGYRVVWGRKDANDNEIRGAPSERQDITNSTTTVTLSWSAGLACVRHDAHGHSNNDVIEISGTGESYDGSHTITVIDANSYKFTLSTQPTTTAGKSGEEGQAFDIDVEFTVPHDLRDGDFYEIYRTALSADASTSPGDELLLIEKVEVADVSALGTTVTYADTLGPAFLGKRLYSNATEQGASQANGRPPWCLFMAQFEGHAFYFHWKTEHEIALQLNEGETDFTTETLTISDGVNTLTVTFASTEVIGSDQAKQFVGATTTGTEAEDIRETVKSLIRVINRSTNSVWYAEYASGDDDPPGLFRIWNRTLFYDTGESDEFYVQASTSTIGNQFSPNISTFADTTRSDRPEGRAGCLRSKFEQPEHVPVFNEMTFGRRSAQVLGVLALVNDVLVFKEDGVFRISGESDGSGGFSFVTDEVDPTLFLRCPDSLVALDNNAFCFTSQGVVRATGDGSAIVSRPIEPDLEEISSALSIADGIDFLGTRGASYEDDRKYILMTQESKGDTYNSVCWVFNYLSSGGVWTRWPKPLSDAIMLGDALANDRRLYACHALDHYVLQERKSLGNNDSDYVDEDIDVTVTATGTTTDEDGNTVSTATVTYDYREPIRDGFLFTQSGRVAKVAGVSGSGTSFVCTLDRELGGLATGAATLSLGIETKITWKPFDGGNATVLKKFVSAQVLFEDDMATRHYLRFHSDTQDDVDLLGVIRTPRSRGWGTQTWGTGTWGVPKRAKSNLVRTHIPRNQTRGRSLQVTYIHRNAQENCRIEQVAVDFMPLSSRTARNPR